MEKRLVVLSGAGISQESGIKTFRDLDGLWYGHDIMQVASLQGWLDNKQIVLDFYNQRRKQVLCCKPNLAHKLICELETYYQTTVITQNVDNLHEKAGSKNIIHLHGELLKVRSTQDSNLIYPWEKDLLPHHTNELGHYLRPHIVWFGETVPLMDLAIEKTQQADIILIIGTSLQVYPAASLVEYAKKGAKIFYIDPNASLTTNSNQPIRLIKDKATSGLKSLMPELIQDSQSTD
ncbi:Sir2 family NAD-dependent protein deacetylase [Myroides sp. LJL119]